MSQFFESIRVKDGIAEKAIINAATDKKLDFVINSHSLFLVSSSLKKVDFFLKLFLLQV
mgnify:CR=1 FL=1